MSDLLGTLVVQRIELRDRLHEALRELLAARHSSAPASPTSSASASTTASSCANPADCSRVCGSHGCNARTALLRHIASVSVCHGDVGSACEALRLIRLCTSPG